MKVTFTNIHTSLALWLRPSCKHREGIQEWVFTCFHPNKPFIVYHICLVCFPTASSMLIQTFWPNHNFCQCTDCFLPIWVAASCLAPLYYVFPADLGQRLLLLLLWPLQPSVGGSTTWSRLRFLSDKGTFSLLLLIVGLETLGFYKAPRYNFNYFTRYTL